MENLFRELYSFTFQLLDTLGDIWEWLTTDYNILGYHLKPLYLLIGLTLIAGIVRQIVGNIG